MTQTITLNPSVYVGRLEQAVATHVGNLRNTLRALEDGSFHKRAFCSRPSAVIQFQVGQENAHDNDAVAASACNRCFLDMVRALIEYLDRMIAIRRCVQQTVAIPQDVTTKEKLRGFVERTVEDAYSQIAHDRGLTNPKKVAEFAGISDLARRSALSYFEVRRCLEHHSGSPESDIVAYTMKMALTINEREVTALPCVAEAGTSIKVSLSEHPRVFQSGKAICITEGDIDEIAFTIQHVIAPEVRRCL